MCYNPVPVSQTDSASRDFDWVTARQACTPQTVLIRLRGLAERDTGRRNEQVRQDQPMHPGFSMDSEDDPTRFGVFARGGRVGVIFRLKDSAIHVESRGFDNPPFEPFVVTIGEMDPETGAGTLTVSVDSEYWLDWQILHYALDELFFGSSVLGPAGGPQERPPPRR